MFNIGFAMRSISTGLLLALAVIGAGCATHNRLPASRDAEGVIVRIERIVSADDHQLAEVSFTNTLSHSIWFAGYGLHSPLYEVEYFRRGRWRDEPIGWCGVGIELQ